MSALRWYASLERLGHRTAWALLGCAVLVVAGNLCGIAPLVPEARAASEWTVAANERAGLPRISRGGAAVLEPGFAFWGENWGWGGFSSRLAVTGPLQYTLTGHSDRLGLELSAQGRVVTPRKMEWTFDLQARQTFPSAVGGGMVFKFDLDAARQVLGEPEIDSDGSWHWGGEGGATGIRVRFEPAVARMFFERGSKRELRAFLFSGSIPAGSYHYKVSVELSGDLQFGPTESERFGLGDPTTWPTDKLDWRRAPVDLSFLNAAEKPAGKHGFLRTRGEQLVFEDGSSQRFWGTNLSAYALFGTPHDVVPEQARRLAALGFNLVRLHHHDSPWVNPNIFGDRKVVTDTRHIDPASQEKLDWWIKCLRDEGIYVWLDLEVQRRFTATDGIWAFDEISKGKPLGDPKGLGYVNLTIQQAEKQFARDYLTHVNPYTRLAYKDDPAVAAVLITNENDLTHHYGNALMPDKKVPEHTRVYMAESNAFAQKYGLPANKTWHAWEPGPGKLLLNDLEYRVNREMVDYLHTLGVKVPVVTTSTWGSNPLTSLPALMAGDMVDVHAYGMPDELERDPAYAASMFDWMASAQVAGRPMTISEWNISPHPAPQRSAAALQVAAGAAFQGWDAIMQYAYAQVPLRGPAGASNWEAFNDPAMLATLPAAALMYRRGDIAPAHETVVFRPSREQLFYESWSARNASALRETAATNRVEIALPAVPELPWLKPSVVTPGARTLSAPALSDSDPRPAAATSDTGEIVRDWKNGRYLIRSARTQAAAGWIGGHRIDLGDVVVDATTPSLSLVVQSLDEHPVAQSSRLMISVSGRAVPAANNRTPYFVEPLAGTVSIRAPKGLRLYRNGSAGDLVERPVAYRGGVYVIPLSTADGTNWLFLSKAP